jgi:hypothetical protein
MGMAYPRYRRRSAQSTSSPSVFGMASSQWYYTETGIPRMCKKIHADNPTIDVSPGDDPLSTQSIIKRVEVTKGMRTLCINLAPDGNDYNKYHTSIAWRKPP